MESRWTEEETSSPRWLPVLAPCSQLPICLKGSLRHLHQTEVTGVSPSGLPAPYQASSGPVDGGLPQGPCFHTNIPWVCASWNGPPNATSTLTPSLEAASGSRATFHPPEESPEPPGSYRPPGGFGR